MRIRVSEGVTNLHCVNLKGTDDICNSRFALEDIKLSSVPLLRQVVNDLVLDVPFYLS